MEAANQLPLPILTSTNTLRLFRLHSQKPGRPEVYHVIPILSIGQLRTANGNLHEKRWHL